MKRIIITSAGILTLLLGILMILPQLGMHRQHPEIWTHGQIKGLTLGLIIATAGASITFYGIKKRKP